MSTKNWVLAIILVALIAAAFIYQGGDQDRSENNFLADVDMEEVDKMEIERDDDLSVLVKEGDSRWRVEDEGDFYVEESVAEELEEKMSALTDAEFELVSTDEEKKEQFRTEGDKSSHVTLYQGEDQVAEFSVGGLDPSTFKNNFISRPDIAETYSAQGVELSNVILKDDWRSRVIFDSSAEDLDKVRFQYPDREFTIEKREGEEEEEEEESQWLGTSPNEFSVDKEAMNEVAEVMTDLEATDIPEQTFEGTGLADHQIIVEASGEDFTNTLMVGAEAEERERPLYYAKKGDSDNIYLITGEQKDTLDRTIESLQ